VKLVNLVDSITKKYPCFFEVQSAPEINMHSDKCEVLTAMRIARGFEGMTLIDMLLHLQGLQKSPPILVQFASKCSFF